jgi:hypothetical protein
MGGSKKTGKPPVKDDAKRKSQPAPQADDDDVEDGDIATPKRDRYGNDDEPLE